MPTTETRQLEFDNLLFRALAVPEEELSTFLDRECGDPGLRARVARALADEAELDGFLEDAVAIDLLEKTDCPEAHIAGSSLNGGEPSSNSDANDGIEVVLGDKGSISHIGPYRILRAIGSGGMGRVFLAEQIEPVRRRLAIKLMRTSLVSPRSVARFGAERQAMARLSHPNIARLYEAGTTADGHPYFAMEHVDGCDLLAFCDRRAATLEERLQLFLDVCAAVHHAHLNQILHRDLKPSNILVADIDGAASVKVIDFGIAKAMDGPLSGRAQLTGDRLPGTPTYMSPEAMAPKGREGHQVDARTDVYSLGIVLYKLLTGASPFEQLDSWAAMLRQISEDDPPRPSRRISSLSDDTRSDIACRRQLEPPQLGRLLRGDLDWIVQKAIAKEPDHRYASVSALAEDIRRHLRHEAVSAGPRTLSYRVGKFARRNRALVWAGLVTGLALVVGIAGLGYGLLRAKEEAAEARRASLEAEAVADFLGDLFAASDRYGSKRRDGRGPEELTALDLLAEGRQRIGDELRGEPAVQARLMGVIGTVYKRMSRHDEAREMLESALQLLRAEDGSDGLRSAAVLQELADLAYRERSLRDADQLYGEVLDIRRRHLGEDHPDLVAPLLGLGRTAFRLDRLDEAEEHLELALQVLDAGDPTGPSAANPEIDRRQRSERALTLSSLLNSLGQLRRAQNRPEETLALWQRALDILVATYGEIHPRVAILVDNIGIAHANMDRLDEAGHYFERALAIREASLPDDDPGIALSLNNLAVHYRDTDRLAACEPLHRRALEIREKAYGPDHPRVAWSLENLGQTLVDLGRIEEATPLLVRSLEIRVARLGDDHRDVARSLVALARADRAAERFDTAELRLRRAVEIRKAKLAPDHPALVSTLEELATLLEEQGKGEPRPGEEAPSQATRIAGAGGAPG